MAEIGAAEPFDVTLTDAEGRPMSESHTTTWADLAQRGITFTAIRAAVPRAVVLTNEEGKELFWQDRMEPVVEGDTVGFGLFAG